MENRLEQFEQMLVFVQTRYAETTGKMDQLKAAGKEKSATFRQLMGDKLMYQSMLNLYKIHGLTDSDK